jgi:hypothetical protein
VSGKRPGLGAVVHITYVDVAEVTAHDLSSIRIVYNEVSVEKPVPVNVIAVPPSTFPYLGDNTLKEGVKVEV